MKAGITNSKGGLTSVSRWEDSKHVMTGLLIREHRKKGSAANIIAQLLLRGTGLGRGRVEVRSRCEAEKKPRHGLLH